MNKRNTASTEWLCPGVLSGQLLLVAALMFTAAAPASDTETESSVGGEPPLVQRCISRSQIRRTEIVDDSTILFEMTGRKTMVNRLNRPCNGLARERRFGYRTSIPQLCRGDTVFILYSTGGRGPGCILGDFELYVEPEVVEPEAGEAPIRIDNDSITVEGGE